MNNADIPINPSTNTYSDAQGNFGEVIYTGITLRQYYAGLAMQGFAAGDDIPNTVEVMAEYSVIWADALLKELDK